MICDAMGADGKKTTLKTAFGTNFYVKLCSEERIPERQKNGTMKYIWKLKPGCLRNEPLDLMNYIYGKAESEKKGGMIAQLWQKVQRLMREREEQEALVAPKALESNAVMPLQQPREVTNEETISQKIPSAAPQRPSTMPRRPVRPMPQKRIGQKFPWSKGLFNPLGI